MVPPVSRGVSSVDELNAALYRLKRDGCTVLVGGDVPELVQRVFSRRVMGEPGVYRLRILALLGRTPDPDDWFPGLVTARSNDSHLVDLQDYDRNMAAVAPQVEEPLPARNAEHVAGTVEESVEGFLRDRYPLPEELRLVAAPGHGQLASTRTIHELVEVLADIEGVTYLVLPERSPRTIDDNVLEQVDAFVMVRPRYPGEPEHRWIIFEEGIETGWLPLKPQS